MTIQEPRVDLDWATNSTFTATDSGEYDGEATTVDAGEAIRDNGFVPEEPVAVEHLNHEIQAGHRNTLSVIQRLWLGTQPLAGSSTAVPFHVVPVGDDHDLVITNTQCVAYGPWNGAPHDRDLLVDVDEVFCATSGAGGTVVFFGAGTAYAEGSPLSGFSQDNDNGVSFDYQVNPWSGDTLTRALVYDPVNLKYIGFGLGSGNDGAITASTPTAGNWTEQDTGRTEIHGHAAVDPDGGIVVAVTFVDATHLGWVATDDGGATWTNDSFVVGTTTGILGIDWDSESQQFVMAAQDTAAHVVRVYVGEFAAGVVTWTLASTLTDREATLTDLHGASAVPQGLLVQCYKGMWLVSAQNFDLGDRGELSVSSDQGVTWEHLIISSQFAGQNRLSSIKVCNGRLYVNLGAVGQTRSMISLE